MHKFWLRPDLADGGHVDLSPFKICLTEVGWSSKSTPFASQWVGMLDCE